MDLFTKAKDLGIQTEFVDGQGHRHVTDAAALKIILDALPVRLPHRFLDGAVVVRSGRPSRTELDRLPRSRCAGKSLPVLRLSRRARRGDRVIAWPADLPEGSYRLHLTDAASFTRGSAVDRRAAKGVRRRFRPLLAAGGAALRRPLGAQLGDRRFHRSRRR